MKCLVTSGLERGPGCPHGDIDCGTARRRGRSGAAPVVLWELVALVVHDLDPPSPAAHRTVEWKQ